MKTLLTMAMALGVIFTLSSSQPVEACGGSCGGTYFGGYYGAPYFYGWGTRAYRPYPYSAYYGGGCGFRGCY